MPCWRPCPALGRAAPRPGRWMEVLRQALAFPMYAASAWLVWVVSQEAGPSGVLAAVCRLGAAGLRRLGARRHANAADKRPPHRPDPPPRSPLLAALAVLQRHRLGAHRCRAGADGRRRAVQRRPPRRAARRGAAGVRQHDRRLVRHLPGQRARGDRHRCGAPEPSPNTTSPT